MEVGGEEPEGELLIVSAHKAVADHTFGGVGSRGECVRCGLKQSRSASWPTVAAIGVVSTWRPRAG